MKAKRVALCSFCSFLGHNVSQVASARGFLLAPHETRAHTACLGLRLSRQRLAGVKQEHVVRLGKAFRLLLVLFVCESDVQVRPNSLPTFLTSFCGFTSAASNTFSPVVLQPKER